MKKILTLAGLAVTFLIVTNSAWATQGPYPSALTDGTFGPTGSITPNSNTNEFELYNAVNLLLGTNYTNNMEIDGLEYSGSGNTATWEQTGNGGYSVIGLGAGNANSLEVYNALTPNVLIDPTGRSFSGNGSVGNGTINSPYIGSPSIFPSGTRFGFALNTVGVSDISGSTSTPAGGTTWYSNPAFNSDLMDHIVVYNLPSLTNTQVYIYDPVTNSKQLVTLNDPFLVGFEDLPLNNNGINSDMDYNDLIFLVNGAVPDSPLIGPHGSSVVPEPMTYALFAIGLMGITGLVQLRKWGLMA